MDIKEIYDRLSKEHELPDYAELDNEFEISDIDNPDFLPRQIRRKIIDKIEHFMSILDSILQPDTGSFAELNECRIFDDEEKHKIFLLYKDLITLKKTNMLLEIRPNMEDNINFIKETYSKWKSIRDDVFSIVSKIKLAWEKDMEDAEKIGYFG